MFCGKCGAEVLDGAKFCEKCGSSVEVKGVTEQETLVKQSNDKQIDVKSAFIDLEEQLIVKIGNGYFTNLLYSKTKKCNLLLTNKRVYLKGVFYNGNGKVINKTKEERILDIEDITGTGFVYRSFSKILLILDILCIIISIAIPIVRFLYNAGWGYDIAFQSIIYLIPRTLVIVVGELLLMKKIMMSRKVHFFIDYAGGRIMIDAKLIGIEDVRDFHKQMRRIKDNIKGKIS